MGVSWTCTIVADAGTVKLAQLDDGGREWSGEGPGGDATGNLSEVLRAAAGAAADVAWLVVVEDIVRNELGSQRRSNRLIKQTTDRWFHTTFANNRASIQRYGLDYRRMTGQGIAGSGAPETPGVFLSNDLWQARWFARMGLRRGAVDIWGADLVDAWLIGDPGASGGSADDWMISPDPIQPTRLTLIEKDITDLG
jgi:hypothetical protein